jgi:hypothetical protein
VSPFRTRALLLLAAFGVGCTHSPFTAGPDQLRSANEDFERSLRFQDYGGAAQFVIPPRRGGFLASRRKEANDLTITDMEVIDVQMAADGQHALVMSRMRWVRLPSVTEVTAEVQGQWDVVDNQWLLVSLAGGPFKELAP